MMRDRENDLRFVLLRHEPSTETDGPSTSPIEPHWDFLLEWDGRCLTWALNEWPQAPRAVVARRLPDHRLVYLTYEGPVPGGRGRVRRVLAGRYHWLHRSSGEYRLELAADRLSIEVGITRPDAVDGTCLFAVRPSQAFSTG